ncbi:MAG: hypothetical protein H7A12_03020 [Pseudomonadales bacterium]|nr:hypothetical protein [Pseudomonadales bacterium]
MMQTFAEDPQALAMLAWARLWSPLADTATRATVWSALGLPGGFDEIAVEYWSAFHGPAPTVSLLLHAALGRDGAAVREDWLRVMDHLELEWEAAQLPPDQLGVACEVFACAVEAQEPVLQRELLVRYLLPWCERALARLESGSGLAALVAAFRDDLSRPAAC